ncbi:MAG: hypothetical protein HQM10_25950 [Candidatus Riflebacteria bacterium]|nr:hypothetical protein [Candidatus Riflebacteria bacterium]
MMNLFTRNTQPETILKKYPNRRIYDPSKNAHVTLTEIADRVKTGEKIKIVDYQTGEDITRVIMGQVLFETLKSRPDYLPLDFLLLMIRAQDVLVRDFLQNALPQYFQYYLELQKRFTGGMGWPQPSLIPGGFFGGMPVNPFSIPSTASSAPQQGTPQTPQSAPPSPTPPNPSQTAESVFEEPDDLMKEIRELKNEMAKLKSDRLSDRNERQTGPKFPPKRKRK